MKPDDDDKRSYDVYNRAHSSNSRWRKQPAREEHQSQDTSK